MHDLCQVEGQQLVEAITANLQKHNGGVDAANLSSVGNTTVVLMLEV